MSMRVQTNGTTTHRNETRSFLTFLFWISLIALMSLTVNCTGEETAAEPKPSSANTPMNTTSPTTTTDSGTKVDPIIRLTVSQDDFFKGTSDECWYNSESKSSQLLDDSGLAVFPGADDGSANAPLFYTVIVHIEPSSSYNDAEPYERDRDRITRLAELFKGYGAKLTIQTQRPFITTSGKIDDGTHKQWQDLGHEVALHIHEDYYLHGQKGLLGADVPYDEWRSAFSGLKSELEGLLGGPVSTWSGGNLYERLFELATAVGLSANTNFKDPNNQMIDPLYLTVSPWRPKDSDRSAHDPSSAVLYLPAGIYPAHCEKSPAAPRPYTSSAFDYLTSALIRSLNVARAGYINVSYTTMHPGDFQNAGNDEAEFQRWEEWLKTVITPLVNDGRLKWKTIREMRDAFTEWEAQ